MQKDRINKLVGELIRLCAEYRAEELEIGAKIIKRAISSNKTEQLALNIVKLKNEIDKSQDILEKREIIRKETDINHIRPRATAQNLERRFSLKLKNIVSNKKRFPTTMSVRLLLKDLFNHEIGNIKDGRERIIKYAIREYSKLPKKDQIQIYNRLRYLSSSISRDFEGYSRIIKRE